MSERVCKSEREEEKLITFLLACPAGIFAKFTSILDGVLMCA